MTIFINNFILKLKSVLYHKNNIIKNISSKYLIHTNTNTNTRYNNNNNNNNDNNIKPILISIEGNIGAGKTTLLNSLKLSNPEWCFIDEPVNYWSSVKNEDGISLLELFYNDRRRWSYTFQNCAMLTRYEIIHDAINKICSINNNNNNNSSSSSSSSCCNNSNNNKNYKVFITERCMDTDYNVFTKLLRDEGSIDKLEYELYKKLYNHLNSQLTPLNAIVHINTSPSICSDRIINRNRSGENLIPLSYLNQLSEYQDNWIKKANLPYIITHEKETDKVNDFINNIVIPSIINK